MKKTILYIIDSLEGIGGTEQTLVASLKDIHYSYNIVLVTLRPANVFDKNTFFVDKQYCLNMQSRTKIFSAAKKLKKIIKENKVVFVHSFLYWSTLVARLACGKKTAHIFKLTTVMSQHVYTNKWYSGYTKILDHLTYKKNQIVVSPTNEVLADFDNSIGVKGRSQIIYNFVGDEFYKNQIEYKKTQGQLKLVAVGNIKEVKNYQVIIDAFTLLPGLPVSIDIYGSGNFKESQQRQIRDHKLAINRMGGNNRIHEVLPKYDAFIMSSLVEGFGISAAEAMAVGLPLLLSDIKVFKEVSDGNAFFFNPSNAQQLADVITLVFNNKCNLETFSERGKTVAKEKYTKQKYINDLLELYNDVDIKQNHLFS
jgi:glycosyltransferase involved in cell wall biosynthesis